MPGLRISENQIRQFADRLKGLEPSRLEISEYSRKYLENHLRSIEYSARLAAQILETGLNKINKTPGQIILAEIGGGTGIISMMAVHLGFKTVIYSDIFTDSCNDFGVISNKAGLMPGKIIHGSVEAIRNEISGQVDLIVSRDVIEHIYDLQDYFLKSKEAFPEAFMVHNTSANIYNVFKRSYFRSIQLKDELEGNPDQIKPGDSQESFRKLRFNYIRSTFPEIPSYKVEFLAEVTRGRNFTDIEKAVEEYLKNHSLPLPPVHKTNTCDPVNGNWTEHLLTEKEYRAMANKCGYGLELKFALYNQWENRGMKKWGMRVINWVIMRGLGARYLSPALLLIFSPRFDNS